jgi:membrane-associated protease RseP (regulator of RpoE activity)
LRQSTLGGAIIDNIIQGSLYVPEGAPTAGIMISLHPIAIAGYISLVVNALSLLPIGSKSPRALDVVSSYRCWVF